MADHLCLSCLLVSFLMVVLPTVVRTAEEMPRSEYGQQKFRPNSFFGEPKPVELAKLTLKSATRCTSGTTNEFNYLTCGRKGQGSQQQQKIWFPREGSRVGWCGIDCLDCFSNNPTDNEDLYVSHFVANCFITDDSECTGSLGCQDLDISVSGQVYHTYKNFALAVDPVKSMPPFGPNCIVFGPGGRHATVNNTADGQGSWSRRSTIGDEATFQAQNMDDGDRRNVRAFAAYYHDEPLPEQVWVPGPGAYPVSAFIYGGQISVFDRSAMNQVATGWLDYVQIDIDFDYSTTPPTALYTGWQPTPSSELSPETLIIRDPWHWKFTFAKEARPSYAN